MRASARSTLLITRMTGRFACSVLRSTNLVCGSGPSPASTSSSTPSTIDRPRSTSPPKSACPGVSTMLMVSPPCRTAVFLARIVMPFSRSRSPESSTRSATRSFARKAPDCQSIASTRVVLPWSTCATIATLRRSSRAVRGRAGIRKPYRLRVWVVRSQPPGHFSRFGNGVLNGSSPGLNAHHAVIIPVEGPYPYDPAGQARSSGLRRLSRLTWRAAQLGTMATVGFAVVFARTAPAATACYRREAGSAGRDTRGLLRVHEFYKVELFAYTTPEDALEAQADILRRAESMLQELELPYRVLDLCTGDLGGSSARTFDLEAYSPGVDRWLEVSSVSWFRDYQARRAGVRFRPEGGGAPQLVHTVNGSALAWPRIWAALVENGRQEDGTVRLPECLAPYMGGELLLKAP